MSNYVKQTDADPNEFRCPTGVIASPTGYYGMIRDGICVGPRRDTIEEARSDAEKVKDLIMKTGREFVSSPIMQKSIGWLPCRALLKIVEGAWTSAK